MAPISDELQAKIVQAALDGKTIIVSMVKAPIVSFEYSIFDIALSCGHVTSVHACLQLSDEVPCYQCQSKARFYHDNGNYMS